MLQSKVPGAGGDGLLERAQGALGVAAVGDLQDARRDALVVIRCAPQRQRQAPTVSPRHQRRMAREPAAEQAAEQRALQRRRRRS